MSRVEELLASMTWDEKLAQMQIVFRPDPAELERWVRAGTGAVFWPRGAAAVNALQRVAVEHTRLGIPLLVGLDVIHGQRTMAPIPLAMAASFDPGMVERTARLAAAEAASGGVNWAFSPMVDVSRDPRWGRVAEGFGEDPFLTAMMGAAMIRGYQGDDLSEPDRIAATAKHFVGYGHAEGGRDYNTADMSEHRLRNVYLEPFRVAAGAGVASVMAAFNTIGGTPMHAHRRLLTGVLKDEWGMGGVIVGDAGGVGNLVPHGVAADLPGAVRQSVRAGLDMEMGGSLTDHDGRALLTPEELPAGRVDDAVRRILTLKARLGLFDQPYVREDAELTEPAGEARALVRAAAARSTVLLKNDGTLPVTPAARVLLTGPYATSTDHLGAWAQSFAAPATSIAAELTHRYPHVNFTVEPGAGFYDDDPADLAAVTDAAARHDLVLVFAGEPSGLSGEAASRSDLRLPGRQEELIRAVAATGAPFAVVLISGRPLVTAGWIDVAPAVLQAWHLGTEAAAAIVDVLTGAAEPAGRLSMSFPRSAGQVPIYYAHENTGRPATVGGTMRPEEVDIGLAGPDNVTGKYTSKYLDLDLGPQFEFGHGGGYTTFRHANARLSAACLPLAALLAGERVTVSIDVTNTGGRDGDEVVQLYLRDLVSSVAQPVRRLVAFIRRHVRVGETVTVSFGLGAEQLGFTDTEEHPVRFTVEPGTFGLFVGGSLQTASELTFEVT
ncbi:MAG: glycoside hydrolase family 3 N-terminal domain-containing protein [Streptosporangiaceae bacterium]